MTRKQLAERLARSVAAAAKLAEQGVRPTGLDGDPIKARLIEANIALSPKPHTSALPQIAAFEAAWGIPTQDALDYARARLAEANRREADRKERTKAIGEALAKLDAADVELYGAVVALMQQARATLHGRKRKSRLSRLRARLDRLPPEFAAFTQGPDR